MAFHCWPIWLKNSQDALLNFPYSAQQLGLTLSLLTKSWDCCGQGWQELALLTSYYCVRRTVKGALLTLLLPLLVVFFLLEILLIAKSDWRKLITALRYDSKFLRFPIDLNLLAGETCPIIFSWLYVLFFLPLQNNVVIGKWPETKILWKL